jgi:hypothetical protein
MNGSLRKASQKFGEQAHLKGNSYTNLIYACNSLLRKFSEISIIPPDHKASRGMSGVILPGCFIKCAEGGGRGGVDFGFLSTTTNESVAVSFLGGKEILFQFDVGDIDPFYQRCLLKLSLRFPGNTLETPLASPLSPHLVRFGAPR